MRALIAAHQADDSRATPLISAMLTRRIEATCQDETEARTLIAAVIDACRVCTFQHDIPSRLIDLAKARMLAGLTQAQGEVELMTPQEAASALKLKTVDTLARWAKAGLIRAVRMPSGRVRYPSDEVARIKRDGVPS